MGKRVIETKSFNLEQPVNRIREIVHFTNVDDLHWAGIVDFPPWEQLPFDTNIYNDLYILQGELIDRTNPSYTSGAFLSPGANKTFTAGPEGARLFAYQDRGALPCDHAMTSHQLDWHMGGTPDMKVASLIGVGHELMLVSWIRGTHMHFHRHPWGEEIFVLQGELRDERGHYPAGTWQRLHPGTGHAPYSETDTLILLRNGHLRAKGSDRNGTYLR